MHEMLNNVLREAIFEDDHVGASSMNEDASNFYGCVEDDNQEMYMSCKFVKLRFIVLLLRSNALIELPIIRLICS